MKTAINIQQISSQNPVALPTSEDEKTALINLQQKQIEMLKMELEVLKHNFGILQRAMFGSKSEKLSEEEIEQLSLAFNEAEVYSVAEQKDLDLNLDDNEIDSAGKNHKKTGRKPLPKNLPRIQMIYDISADEKNCECGCQLSKIGEEISEQLDYVPARLQVIEHIRYKYACKGCEETVRCAAVPLKPIPKANATAGLLSHILISKFEDHLPLYRQSNMWERLGIDISRSTMSNWVMACGDLLNPLVELLRKDIVSKDYVASDETPLRVINSTTDTSYMWVHIGGERERRAIVYDYNPNRSGACASEFLKGFKGYHQCDAYGGYNKLHSLEYIIWVACWAHARRKFYDIIKLVKTAGVAHKIIHLIRKLYAIEREALDKKLSYKEMYKLRQEKAVPILAEIKEILEDYKDKVPPKSALGGAIAYSLNHWQGLNAYLLDGRIRIDNNDSERTIKPFAVGRKNWMFCVTTNGAKASANIYSIIQTCKANQINTYAYLRYVLQNIMTAKTEAELRALLPYNVEKQLLSF